MRSRFNIKHKSGMKYKLESSDVLIGVDFPTDKSAQMRLYTMLSNQGI